MLLESRWFDAEEAAVAALTTNRNDQFALYIAAEAAVQRNDPTTARRYLTELQPGPVTEPALCALRTTVEDEANDRRSLEKETSRSMTSTMRACG